MSFNVILSHSNFEVTLFSVAIAVYRNNKDFLWTT